MNASAYIDKGLTVHRSLLFLDRQEQLEFRWQLFLAIQPIREVYSSDPTIGMNAHSQRLYVVASICSSREITQIELNLIPTLIQTHRHSADERLDSGC